MKSENKLEGASNFRAWKTKIDLILAKNKVLDIVKGKIVEPQFDEGKEKEPQNIAIMEHRTIWWTPCAAHCLDLMLEDIGKIEWVKKTV
jgi:hypothetical protein